MISTHKRVLIQELAGRGFNVRRYIYGHRFSNNFTARQKTAFTGSVGIIEQLMTLDERWSPDTHFPILTSATKGDSPGTLTAHTTSRSFRCCKDTNSSVASASARPHPPGLLLLNKKGYTSGDEDVSWTLTGVSLTRHIGAKEANVHCAETDQRVSFAQEVFGGMRCSQCRDLTLFLNIQLRL